MLRTSHRHGVVGFLEFIRKAFRPSEVFQYLTASLCGRDAAFEGVQQTLLLRLTSTLARQPSLFPSATVALRVQAVG
jgi:hypothetical protein